MAWKAVETIPIRIHGRISQERAHAVRAALLPRCLAGGAGHATAAPSHWPRVPW